VRTYLFEKTAPKANPPITMELIHITTDAQGAQVVSARELYSFLQIQTEFPKWCERMFEYGFTENQDFNLVKIDEVRSEGNRQVKRELIDYALTLSTAKEIAMLQRNDRGKQARQYFIECERKLQSGQKALTPTEALLATVQRMVDIERDQQLTNKRLDKLEAEINNVSEEHYSLEGYYGLRKWKWGMTLPEAQEKGRKLKALSGVMNYPVNKCYSVQYGEKNAYHKAVLDKYFNDILGKS
jgi:phage anti-repressor protein